MSPGKYVQEAVRNCTINSAAYYGGRFRLPNYDPKLDTSPELDPDAVFYYLTIIGV